MNTQSFIFNSSISVSFNEAGYLNATAIAAHFGKLVGNYLRNERTQEYISALAENLSVMRNRITDKNELVIKKQGGTEQGTWLHPKLAVDFARWLDPKFAVWCDSKIEEILGIGSQSSQSGYLNEWERHQIQNGIKQRCDRTGETRQAVYRKLHAFMQVNSYELIRQADFQTALNFLASMENAPTLFSEPQGIAMTEEQVYQLSTLTRYAAQMSELYRHLHPALRRLGSAYSGEAASWAEVPHYWICKMQDFLMQAYKQMHNPKHIEGVKANFALMS